MDFFKLAEERRSIRAYKPDEISEKDFKMILETANLAPSAGNLQSYEIFVIRDREKKEHLVKAAGEQAFIAQAPVVLVFCACPYKSALKYGKRGLEMYAIQDATISAAFAMLAASSLGIGSVWVGAFEDDKVLDVLENPRNVKPVAIIPFGYPDESPLPGARKRLSEIVHEI
ncbi:MAG: nitroreductase family protein [Candidatus Aenigmatarchaeota archaeon]